MKLGEFPDGERVLRVKIDMALQILNMRDPILYRIAHTSHHNTGDKWYLSNVRFCTSTRGCI